MQFLRIFNEHGERGFKIMEVDIEWTPIQVGKPIHQLPFTKPSDHDEEECTDVNNNTDNESGESKESTEECSDKKDGDTKVSQEEESKNEKSHQIEPTQGSQITQDYDNVGLSHVQSTNKRKKSKKCPLT